VCETSSRKLKTFTRADKDRRVPISLEKTIDGALEIAQNEIRYRARVVKDYSQLPALLANDGKLAQVFLNLIVNAVQSIEEGQAEENEIRVRTYAEEDYVVAELSDTGEGIAEEHLAHVFDPFFSSKAIGKASGLSLAICHNLVTEMGGTIAVESTVGRGTTFRVRLPAPKAAPQDLGTDIRDEARAPVVRRRYLVIDDEAPMGTAIERMLAPHEVHYVSSGTDAISLLEQDQAFRRHHLRLDDAQHFGNGCLYLAASRGSGAGATHALYHGRHIYPQIQAVLRGRWGSAFGKTLQGPGAAHPARSPVLRTQ
jgi:two-component system cell cycle sensor histidine kinase/response regulator CckA